MPFIETEHPMSGVTCLTLTRPDRLNALNGNAVAELHEALTATAKDPECRVVILTGSGRAFCAGGDLKDEASTWRPETPVSTLWESQTSFSNLTLGIRRMPQPVIAAVNGPAMGAGFVLAACCDLRLASTSACFAASFANIGLSGCDMGLSWLLPGLVGVGRAHEIMLTGRTVSADEALSVGLVLNTYPDSELMDQAMKLAKQLLDKSRLALSHTKEVMWSSLETPSFEGVIQVENRTQVLLSRSQEHHVAVERFNIRNVQK